MGCISYLFHFLHRKELNFVAVVLVSIQARLVTGNISLILISIEFAVSRAVWVVSVSELHLTPPSVSQVLVIDEHNVCLLQVHVLFVRLLDLFA